MKQKIAVIGLGYVGLPVAINFFESGFPIIGFDQDTDRLNELRSGIDRTHQVTRDRALAIAPYTTKEASLLEEADVYIILTQTGLDADKNPDLSAVISAVGVVSPYLRKGVLVVLSSTVTIGFTRGAFLDELRHCRPDLEPGVDYSLAYAPERFDPGNPKNTLRSIRKVVAGYDQVSLERVAALYRETRDEEPVCAKAIEVVEASRLLENAQRDANIALLNDMSAIFAGCGLDTNDVLDVANTKWNFLPFRPGLVGGHCVNVHTHYLIQAAKRAGQNSALPTLIRDINDNVPKRIADACVDRLFLGNTKSPRLITVMGIAYKENVPDVRGSAAVQIVRHLINLGCHVQVTDPYVSDRDLRSVHQLELIPDAKLEPADAIIVALAHAPYADAGWSEILPKLKGKQGVVIDVRGVLPNVPPPGIDLWRL